MELDWFLERVGKTIIRNVTTCTISGCDSKGYTLPVSITDEQHARLLYSVHIELGAEFSDEVEAKQEQTT